MGLWRRKLLVAALSIAFAGPVAAQQPDPEIQRAFVEGAQRLQAGDYEGAARIFRELTHKTDSPRVKLELARALFYLKQYDESRRLFKAVLLEPELPWRVRDNVEVFLRAIDEVDGYARFALSVVSDSNPRNITPERQFSIGGVRLTFEPPQDNKRVTGLRYSFQGMQPILRESRVSAYFTASYLDYPSQSLDRLTADGGLSRRLGTVYGEVRAGIEGGTFGGQYLYRFPYLELSQRLSESPVHRIDGAVKGGRVTFPYYSYLDANYGSVSLSAARSLSQALAGLMKATLEVSDTRERPYSYYGVTLEPGMSLLVERPAAHLLRAGIALGHRQYAADHPLFGVTRRDRRIALEASLRNKEWRWMNFTPALALSLERNESNIDFYSYRKANIYLVLE
jgi:outer membrane protein